MSILYDTSTFFEQAFWIISCGDILFLAILVILIKKRFVNYASISVLGSFTFLHSIICIGFLSLAYSNMIACLFKVVSDKERLSYHAIELLKDCLKIIFIVAINNIAIIIIMGSIVAVYTYLVKKSRGHPVQKLDSEN